MSSSKAAAAAAVWPDRFLGGAVCLDFINTVEHAGSARAEDRFKDYPALLQWAEAREVMGRTAVRALGQLAKQAPSAAEAVFKQGLSLRLALKTLVERLQRGGGLQEATGLLNAQLSLMDAHPVLQAPPGANGLERRLGLVLPGRALNEPLAPVLWSAVALLTSNDVERLGQCQAMACEYVFVDHSKNRSRLWCSTLGCGNRERVRRNYRGGVKDGPEA